MTGHGNDAGQENSSPGGVSMFHDIDRSGAFCPQAYRAPPVDTPLTVLEDWFSVARISRYANSPYPGLLYVWNVRLSKAFLEDVGHVEVLLRNFINHRLAKDCGSADWYHGQDRYHFNRPFQTSVAKVEKQLRDQSRTITPDQVIARLSFDNWRFLLTPRHEVTVWKALIDPRNGGLPHYQRRRRHLFEADVELIRQLRNRTSHQEPLIITANQTHAETKRLDAYAAALDNTARRINPDAVNWIQTNSRVTALRTLRPDHNTSSPRES